VLCVGVAGPQRYRILKFVVGSCRMDSILLADNSFMDSFYGSESNFVNKFRGTPYIQPQVDCKIFMCPTGFMSSVWNYLSCFLF